MHFNDLWSVERNKQHLTYVNKSGERRISPRHEGLRRQASFPVRPQGHDIDDVLCVWFQVAQS